MERKKLIKFDVSSMSYKRHRMTKSVDNTTNILKRKRKTSTSSGEVEKSLSKSAFPEIDGHITNLVKSKALNHNLESHSEIKYTQYRFITNGHIQGVPSIGTHFRFQFLTFLMVLSKKSNSAILTQMV